MAVTSESGFDNHLLVHFFVTSSKEKVFSFSTRYALSGSPAPALSNINEIATQLATGFATEIAAVLPTDCSFGGTQVIYYGGSTSFEGFSVGEPVPGSGENGESLPEEDCVVIRKRTGKPGRTHRGRMFIPLVPEEFQDESRLNATGIIAYEALAHKFKNVWTFSGTLSGMTGTPKHAAWAAGTLDTIVETGIVVDVLNRRDRRDPRRLIYQASPA